MTAIDEEPTRGARTPSVTTVIAIGAAAVMLIVVGVIGYLLWTAADHSSPGGAEAPTLLVNTASYVDFSGELPSDWHTIGKLPLEFVHSTMRYAPPAGPGTAPSNSTAGGGVAWSQSIAPGEPFAFIVNLRVHHPEENLIAQVFVSDTPEFNDENATTPHELLWLIQGHQAQVILPSGRVEAQTELPKDYKGNFVRVVVDRDQATVELSGKKFWSGPSGLDPTKPSYVGVRFLRRAPDASGDGVVFESVRVNTRQK